MSSTTIPEPLSAFLIISELSDARSFSAILSSLVKFGITLYVGIVIISCFILFRYASIFAEALGGYHVLFCLKGCGSWGGSFLK